MDCRVKDIMLLAARDRGGFQVKSTMTLCEFLNMPGRDVVDLNLLCAMTRTVMQMSMPSAANSIVSNMLALLLDNNYKINKTYECYDLCPQSSVHGRSQTHLETYAEDKF